MIGLVLVVVPATSVLSGKILCKILAKRGKDNVCSFADSCIFDRYQISRNMKHIEAS